MFIEYYIHIADVYKYVNKSEMKNCRYFILH